MVGERGVKGREWKRGGGRTGVKEGRVPSGGRGWWLACASVWQSLWHVNAMRMCICMACSSVCPYDGPYGSARGMWQVACGMCMYRVHLRVWR